MDILNQTVRHKTFGTGRVSAVDDNIVTVRFGPSDKKFFFPEAFREYLLLSDKDCRRYVETILTELDKKEEKDRKKELRLAEKRRLLDSLPLHQSAQIALGCVYGQDDPPGESWNAFVGSYKSGENKGKPRVPARALPNSACLLTYRKTGQPEESRHIRALFMADDGFIGSECTDGVIPAHGVFRILLDENESARLPFWKYCGSDTAGPNKKWGSVKFKYCANTAVAQVLSDILEMRRGTGSEKLCAEFFDYFCKLNKIDSQTLERI